MSRLSRAMSPAAFVISVLALIVALSAGSAYAAVKIGTAQLKNNAVTSTKIKNKTIKTGDLASSTVKSLRGKAGPAGARGPQGPGSVKIDKTLAPTGAFENLDFPLGQITVMCSAGQVYTGLSGKTGGAPNPLSIAGMFQADDEAPASRSLGAVSSVGFSSPTSKFWADLQVGDATTNTFGTLRIHAKRAGSACRWQIQYIP